MMSEIISMCYFKMWTIKIIEVLGLVGWNQSRMSDRFTKVCLRWQDAQRVKVLAVEPNYLSLISEILMVKGEDQYL